jgi:hypothetical protein
MLTVLSPSDMSNQGNYLYIYIGLGDYGPPSPAKDLRYENYSWPRFSANPSQYNPTINFPDFSTLYGCFSVVVVVV